MRMFVAIFVGDALGHGLMIAHVGALFYGCLYVDELLKAHNLSHNLVVHYIAEWTVVLAWLALTWCAGAVFDAVSSLVRKPRPGE